MDICRGLLGGREGNRHREGSFRRSTELEVTRSQEGGGGEAAAVIPRKELDNEWAAIESS